MLLDYALLTAPTPLQAGSSATLTLTISNGGRQFVTVTKIVITLPIGTDAKDLTAGTGFQTGAPSGWNIAQNGGVLTLTPTGSGAIGADAVVVTIADVAVNDQPGTTNISIDETAAVGSGTPVKSSTSLPAAKFPAQFSLSDLVVTPNEVAFGGSASVMWTGTQADQVTYTLQYPGVAPIDVPNVGPYQAVNLTIFPAVFTLTASLTVPGQDQPAIVEKQATAAQAPQLKISFFGSSRASVGGADSFDLIWEVQQATSLTLAMPLIPGSTINVTGQSRCTVSPQGNNLIVTDHAGNPLGTFAVPGSPLQLQFTLTASNATLSENASTDVNILLPTIGTFTVTGGRQEPARPPVFDLWIFNATWTTANAASVVIEPLFGAVATSGTWGVSHAGQPNFTGFTITATGYWGVTASKFQTW
jgi:hypothetical protein